MKEETSVEEPKKEESVDDASLLMEELKKLNVETPNQVQDMAFAAQETGKAWNEVGALRKQVEQLTSQLNRPAPQTDEYGSESIDLGKVVEEKVQGVLNNYLNQQRQSQMAVSKVMSEVRSDPEYGIVGDVFEKYINSPESIMKLQAGQTDYKTEYLNTKAAYYRNLAQRSSKTLEGMMQTKQQAPPHMEQGDTGSQPAPNIGDESKEQFNKIKKGQREGAIDSDQALEAIIKNSMPGMDDTFYMP